MLRLFIKLEVEVSCTVHIQKSTVATLNLRSVLLPSFHIIPFHDIMARTIALSGIPLYRLASLLNALMSLEVQYHHTSFTLTTVVARDAI